MSDKFPNSIVGDDENFSKRMGVEMAIAKLELGIAFDNLADNWLKASSDKIRIIFDRRASEESDFLGRCVSDLENVAKEISGEMGK